MSAEPVAVLLAIIEEVAGGGQPFSADSYLPPHLVFAAQHAINVSFAVAPVSGIEAQAAGPASALEAHETILRTRLAKADEMIASLRAEIDSLRRPNITCQPSGAVSGLVPLMLDPLGRLGLDPDPFMRLTAYGRHPECDE